MAADTEERHVEIVTMRVEVLIPGYQRVIHHDSTVGPFGVSVWVGEVAPDPVVQQDAGVAPSRLV